MVGSNFEMIIQIGILRYCLNDLIASYIAIVRMSWNFGFLTTPASPLLREKTGSAMDTRPGPCLLKGDYVEI
jgi:hypothetical protein